MPQYHPPFIHTLRSIVSETAAESPASHALPEVCPQPRIRSTAFRSAAGSFSERDSSTSLLRFQTNPSAASLRISAESQVVRDVSGRGGTGVPSQSLPVVYPARKSSPAGVLPGPRPRRSPKRRSRAGAARDSSSSSSSELHSQTSGTHRRFIRPAGSDGSYRAGIPSPGRERSSPCRRGGRRSVSHVLGPKSSPDVTTEYRRPLSGSSRFTVRVYISRTRSKVNSPPRKGR